MYLTFCKIYIYFLLNKDKWEGASAASNHCYFILDLLV